jgi:hypothetical protein
VLCKRLLFYFFEKLKKLNINLLTKEYPCDIIIFADALKKQVDTTDHYRGWDISQQALNLDN